MEIAQPHSELLRALWSLETVGNAPEFIRAPQDMRDRIEKLGKLPPLPEIAYRIMDLRNDPFSDARKLARIVEMDPALAAQVIRWANSAIYGMANKVITVKDAITLVLGFDYVFNLALGLCALKPLQAPTDGLLGKRFFWRQTLAGSALMQKLTLVLAPNARPDLISIHLIYLLHNTGHLLLAHLFPDEFNYVIRLAEANPQAPLFAIERFTLGCDHGQLGAWLMQGWRMPEYLVTVIQHHHNPFYRGEHEMLVWLTCLTDRLLGEIGIGDASPTHLAESPLYEHIGISEEQAKGCLEQIALIQEELEQAVNSLI